MEKSNVDPRLTREVRMGAKLLCQHLRALDLTRVLGIENFSFMK